MRKIERSVAIGIILLSFAISLYLYPQMPENVASHWNAQGQVDGYMPKFWALLLMPLISAGFFLLFIAIPRIDPLKANIEKFRRYYERFVLVLIAFMFYIHVLTILWNMGTTFNLMQALSPAFGVLFYYCGVLIANAKQNWFIGIRTPWTMSSEKVWDKTHRLGGRLFKVSAVIAIFGALLPDYAIFLILVPVIVFTVYTFIFSYLEYQREHK